MKLIGRTFEAFCTAAAQRYKGFVRYYEFWNEPNYYYMAFDVNEYTKWPGRAHNALKAGDTTALVSVGGLDISSIALGPNQPNPDRFDTSYLQGIYNYIAANPGNYFDAVALHPYENRPELQGIPTRHRSF